MIHEPRYRRFLTEIALYATPRLVLAVVSLAHRAVSIVQIPLRMIRRFSAHLLARHQWYESAIRQAPQINSLNYLGSLLDCQKIKLPL